MCLRMKRFETTANKGVNITCIFLSTTCDAHFVLNAIADTMRQVLTQSIILQNGGDVHVLSVAPVRVDGKKHIRYHPGPKCKERLIFIIIPQRFLHSDQWGTTLPPERSSP